MKMMKKIYSKIEMTKRFVLKMKKKYKNLNYYIMKLLVVNIEEFKV